MIISFRGVMMGVLTIYQDNYTDSTVISNRFIDEYMQMANDAQLKIYLYLIRMMSARLDTSIGAIADKFNYTEKDVIRALKYWEKNGLLLLDYDERKNIAGIHLMDSATPSVNMTMGAPSVGMTTYPSFVPAVYPDGPAAAPSSILTETVAPSVPDKPNYTAQQLQAF